MAWVNPGWFLDLKTQRMQKKIFGINPDVHLSLRPR